MRELIQPKIKGKCRLICRRLKRTCLIFVPILALFAAFGCGRQIPQKSPNTYTMTVAELEKNYGRLITVANMPTDAQNGTGDRLGLFGDESGTFWGIPLTRDDQGNVVGCAPWTLRKVPVSDTLPADTAEILGAANEPTHWRGGTGNLELLLRKKEGGMIWYSVKEVETKPEPVCWSLSDPVQPLTFYRLIIGESK